MRVFDQFADMQLRYTAICLLCIV